MPHAKPRARPRLSPHQRIMRAAAEGRGVRLSADEVDRLSRDDAISTCAAGDDERDAAIMRGESYDDADWQR